MTSCCESIPQSSKKTFFHKKYYRMQKKKKQHQLIDSISNDSTTLILRDETDTSAIDSNPSDYSLLTDHHSDDMPLVEHSFTTNAAGMEILHRISGKQIDGPSIHQSYDALILEPSSRPIMNQENDQVERVDEREESPSLEISNFNAGTAATTNDTAFYNMDYHTNPAPVMMTTPIAHPLPLYQSDSNTGLPIEQYFLDQHFHSQGLVVHDDVVLNPYPYYYVDHDVTRRGEEEDEAVIYEQVNIGGCIYFNPVPHNYHYHYYYGPHEDGVLQSFTLMEEQH